MRKVTALIPCFNEEQNLAHALRSVQWADEVLVVDSFSTDKSVQIAQEMGATVLQHAYENSAAQKNRFIPKATHQWVFILDADEVVSTDLATEIQQILALDEEPFQAYWIGRSNDFMGKRIRYSGWQGDKVIRLFKRDLCKYEEKRVHAEIVCNGKVGMLKHKLLHNTYKGIDPYLLKLNRYAKWQAEDLFAKGKKTSAWAIVVKPAFRFFKHFVLQKGFLDGFPGFTIAALQAYGVFLRYAKLWLLHKNSH
jgi:glycosyltransferase involved in cell wall biosynthesis